MKSNMQVILDFMSGKTSRNAHLRTDGFRLVNYSTCICEKTDDGYIMNETKYSVTTSKIQSWTRGAIKNKYIPTNRYVPMGTTYLGYYI